MANERPCFFGHGAGGDKQGLGKAGVGGDSQPPVMQIRALAGGGDKSFVGGDVVHRPGNGAPVLAEGDRHGALRVLVNVVGGAVNGVDDPALFLVACCAGFFAEDAVGGKFLREFVNDKLLHFAVGVGDGLAAVFSFDSVIGGVKPSPRQPPGAPGQLRRKNRIDRHNGIIPLFLGRGIMAAMKKDIKDFACFIYKLKKDFVPAYRALFRAKAGHRRWLSPLEKGAMNRAGGRAYSESMFRFILAAVIISCCAGVFLGAFMLAAFLFFKPVFWGLAALFALAVLSLPVLEYQERDYFDGASGERDVGEKLDKMVARPQWRVFHSFHTSDIGGGDIDHIVVCPKGVFCVETKALRKSPEKVDNTVTFENGKLSRGGRELPRNPISQARGNAAKLRDYLNSRGAAIDWVCAIIALPGQWVVSKSPIDEKGPCPCNPKQIASFIDREREDEELSNEQINKICDVLEAHNRIELT